MPISDRDFQLQQLKSLGFCSFHEPSAKEVKAVTERCDTACGLYCLELLPGLFYIGQTTNIAHRLKQHEKSRAFIAFSFFPVKKQHLKSQEKYTLAAAEKKRIKLTNLDHSSTPCGITSLDTIFPADAQHFWLIQSPSSTQLSPHRRPQEANPHQRNCFARLTKHERWQEICHIAASYIAACIPLPIETEKSYWCVTCLPGTTTGDLQRLFCFNLNRMETFVLFHARQRHTDIYSLLIVSKDSLEHNYKGINNFKRAHPHCLCHNSTYVAAGGDQIAIETSDFEALQGLFASPYVIRAAKDLNLRLMRKGKTVYARHHNPLLADALFDVIKAHDAPRSGSALSLPNIADSTLEGSNTP